MKQVSLSGSLRENVGKKDAKKNRRDGLVPAVLYGGENQIHFTVADKQFNKIIISPDVFLINLTIDGKEYLSILQDVQFHPVTDETLHIDFLQVIEGKPVTVGIPVRLEGVAPGILQGGRLYHKIKKILARGLAEDLPDYIVVNIDDLNIGGGVMISELDFEKLTFLENEKSLVVAVRMARGAAEDEEEEDDEEGEEGEEGAEGAEGGEKAPAEK